MSLCLRASFRCCLSRSHGASIAVFSFLIPTLILRRNWIGSVLFCAPVMLRIPVSPCEIPMLSLTEPRGLHCRFFIFYSNTNPPEKLDWKRFVLCSGDAPCLCVSARDSVIASHRATEPLLPFFIFYSKPNPPEKLEWRRYALSSGKSPCLRESFRYLLLPELWGMQNGACASLLSFFFFSH